MIQLSNVEVKVILQAKQTEMNSSTQTTMSGYSLDTSQILYYLPLEELEFCYQILISIKPNCCA